MWSLFLTTLFRIIFTASPPPLFRFPFLWSYIYIFFACRPMLYFSHSLIFYFFPVGLYIHYQASLHLSFPVSLYLPLVGLYIPYLVGLHFPFPIGLYPILFDLPPIFPMGLYLPFQVGLYSPPIYPPPFFSWACIFLFMQAYTYLLFSFGSISPSSCRPISSFSYRPLATLHFS